MIVWHLADWLKDRPDLDRPFLGEPQCRCVAVQVLLSAQEQGRAPVFDTRVSSILNSERCLHLRGHSSLVIGNSDGRL